MDGWTPQLRAMVPSYGTKLSDDPKLAAKTLKSTLKALAIAK
jgi:malate dehydrogenase (quinone)